jgi:DDE superfamily endonuclease
MIIQPPEWAVSGFAHEYERHGTTTLFAALDTATGLVKAGHYKRRRRREFLDFMNGVIDAYGNEKEIHVILDNLNTHKAQARPLAQEASERSFSFYAEPHFVA